jgi:hypothetical protein
MLKLIELVHRDDAAKAFLLLRAANKTILPLESEQMYIALTINLERLLGPFESDLQLAQTEPVPLCRDEQKHHPLYDLGALDDYMDVWLQNRCGGLLEITNGKASYIHRTVRDF